MLKYPFVRIAQYEDADGERWSYEILDTNRGGMLIRFGWACTLRQAIDDANRIAHEEYEAMKVEA